MKCTQHILIILLAIGLVIPKDVMQFAVGVPAILQHYKHHNEVHGKISFIDFIKEHSANTDKNKNDHEHDNLPFNHHHSSDYSQALTYIRFYQNESLKSLLPLSFQEKIKEEQFFLGSDFCKNIWQPPKV